jgi:hypothetical protein
VQRQELKMPAQKRLGQHCLQGQMILELRLVPMKQEPLMRQELKKLVRHC